MSGISLLVNDANREEICSQVQRTEKSAPDGRSQAVQAGEQLMFLSDVDYDNFRAICSSGVQFTSFELQGHNVVDTLRQIYPRFDYPPVATQIIIDKVYRADPGRSVTNEYDQKLIEYVNLAESMGVSGLVNTALDNLYRKRPDKVTFNGLIGHILTIISVVEYKNRLEEIGIDVGDPKLGRHLPFVIWVDGAIDLLASGRVYVECKPEKELRMAAQYESDENSIRIPDKLTQVGKSPFAGRFERGKPAPLFSSLVHECYHMASDYKRDVKTRREEEAAATLNQMLATALAGIEKESKPFESTREILTEGMITKGGQASRLLAEMKANADYGFEAGRTANFIIEYMKGGGRVWDEAFIAEAAGGLRRTEKSYESYNVIAGVDSYIAQQNPVFNERFSREAGPKPKPNMEIDCLKIHYGAFGVVKNSFPYNFTGLRQWIDSSAEAEKKYYGIVLDRPFNEWPTQYKKDYMAGAPHHHLQKVVIPLYAAYLNGFLRGNNKSESEAFIFDYYIPAVRAFVALGDMEAYSGIPD